MSGLADCPPPSVLGAKFWGERTRLERFWGKVKKAGPDECGHKARKRTWLFASTSNPPELDWSRPAGTHQVGWFDRIKPTLSKREASATPPAFRDALLDLARQSRALRGAA